MSEPTLGGVTAEPLYAEAEAPARVVANSAWLLFGQAIGTLITGGVGIYAVRHFSPGSWGHYSTAIALVSLFTIFAGAGLAPLALRELASAPERGDEILGTTFQALGVTFAVSVVGLLVTAVALGYPREVLVLVVVLAPSLFFDPSLANLGSAFNARSRLEYVALFQVTQAVVYGTLAVVVITASFGIAGLAVAVVTAGATAFVLALALLRSRLGWRPHLIRRARRLRAFLRDAVPIGGINLVAVVYAWVDVILLSVLSTSAKVAFYTVPYGVVRLSWLLPSAVSAAFFPLLSRRLESADPEAEYLFFLVVRAFLFLSVPISLLLALSSPTLLPFVFGDAYSHSVSVLQIMAWTSVFGFTNYILWYGILAARRERTVFFVQLGGLAVNVAINAVAIPLYGASGAAAALLISDLVVVAGQVVIVHRSLFAVPFADLLVKPAAAAVVTVPVAVLASTRSPVGGAALGAIAYVAILLALRYITFDEWRPVAAVVRAPFVRLTREGRA